VMWVMDVLSGVWRRADAYEEEDWKGNECCVCLVCVMGEDTVSSRTVYPCGHHTQVCKACTVTLGSDIYGAHCPVCRESLCCEPSCSFNKVGGDKCKKVLDEREAAAGACPGFGAHSCPDKSVYCACCDPSLGRLYLVGCEEICREKRLEIAQAVAEAAAKKAAGEEEPDPPPHSKRHLTLPRCMRAPPRFSRSIR